MARDTSSFAEKSQTNRASAIDYISLYGSTSLSWEHLFVSLSELQYSFQNVSLNKATAPKAPMTLPFQIEIDWSGIREPERWP